MAANGTRPLVDRMTAPRWGVSIPLDEDTEGFRSDRPGSLLSKFHLSYYQGGVYRDETLLATRTGNIRFRYGLMGSYLRGRSDNVTVGDLKKFSPELVGFMEEAPKLLEFDRFETRVFNATGREILDGEIVPGVTATSLGLSGFAGLSIAGGHQISDERWHLFVAEFTLGLSAGASYLNLSVKKGGESKGDTMYGWNVAPTFALGIFKFCDQVTGSCITPSLEFQIGIIRAEDKTRAVFIPVLFQLTIDTALIEEFFDPGKHPL